MKRSLKALILLGTAMCLNTAFAGGLSLSKRDCEDILRRWADDPTSVPQALVDACKEVLAADSMVPDVKPAAGPVADPCADPASADNVQCWGPWAALSPQAGPAGGPIALPGNPPNLRPEDFGPGADVAGTPEEQLPLGSCSPGAPCGFATIVAGNVGTAPAADTNFVPFDLADDGTSFVVDPGGSGELISVSGMSTRFVDNQGTEELTAFGRDGTRASGLIARVYRYGGAPIVQATELWQHVGDTVQSGNFAWGIATPQADLDALNAGNVTASFAGQMSGDNQTIGQMTIQFGSQPSWSGNWTNPAYTFDAGGRVLGADLISDPGRFSSNVQDGVVQGGLVGEAGAQGVAHIIDVTLDNVGQVKDVGLLLQQ